MRHDDGLSLGSFCKQNPCVGMNGTGSWSNEKDEGAFINEDPLYLQATGFVLRPDGTVAVAVYSSEAIGRLVAADTINFLKYLQKAQ